MVRPDGFEPPTNWFEASYSIHLSYERMLMGLALRWGNLKFSVNLRGRSHNNALS